MPRCVLADRDLAALEYITERLRDRDREEIFATRWDADAIQLAKDTFNAGEFQWVAWVAGEPVASIGAAPIWPGVWQVWAYGTENWPRAALTLTRHVRRFMIPALLRDGAHRAQCFAMEKHVQACRWLERLGAKRDAVLDNYGGHGQTFVLYSWQREQLEETVGCAGSAELRGRDP